MATPGPPASSAVEFADLVLGKLLDDLDEFREAGPVVASECSDGRRQVLAVAAQHEVLLRHVVTHQLGNRIQVEDAAEYSQGDLGSFENATLRRGLASQPQRELSGQRVRRAEHVVRVSPAPVVPDFRLDVCPLRIGLSRLEESPPPPVHVGRQKLTQDLDLGPYLDLDVEPHLTGGPAIVTPSSKVSDPIGGQPSMPPRTGPASRRAPSSASRISPPLASRDSTSRASSALDLPPPLRPINTLSGASGTRRRGRT
jgi:hypothetical protein